MATVLIPLAQGCEELEAVTVMDLLVRAGVTVITASLDQKPVTASRGAVLIATTTIDQVNADQFDMIVLPGGLPGADHLGNDPHIAKLLQHMQSQNKFIAAICAAPKVLANAGLLDGTRATCYPGVLDTMSVKGLIYEPDSAVVIDGNIVTSKGPGTAMDFALALITLLCGQQKRDEVESGLQRS